MDNKIAGENQRVGSPTTSSERPTPTAISEESSARAHLRAKRSPTCSAALLAPNDESLPPRERAPSANRHMRVRTEPWAIVARMTPLGRAVVGGDALS